MNISSAYALLPRTAKKMSSGDYMNYFNYVVGEDLYGILFSRYPEYYKKKFQVINSAQTLTGTFSTTTITTAAHGLVVGDVVRITDSTDAVNGKYVVLTVPTILTFTIAKSGTGTCTVTIPYKVTLPTGIVSVLHIQDTSYGTITRDDTSIFDSLPLSVQIVDTQIIVPVQSPLTTIEITYEAEITQVTQVSDDLPLPSTKHKELVSCVNYGIALSWARDWKKADDIKVFYDSYMQAKANLTRLSNGILG